MKHKRTFTLIILLTVLYVGTLTVPGVCVTQKSESPFPKINGKFGSKTESQVISDAVLDYGGKVRLIFRYGKIHRPRQASDKFRFYFEGNAELQIIDTSALDNLWAREFIDSYAISGSSIYICGHHIPKLLHLDSTAWREDKISRKHFRRLRFRVKAPNKYFGIDLSGELVTWAKSDTASPPIWVDMRIRKDKQLALYVTPEIEEQLNLYVYDELTSEPFLVGAFSLNHALVSHPVTIDSTIVSTLLKESGRFDASCRIVFAPGTDRRGLSMTLPHLYSVDSVIDADGHHLAYIKKHYRNMLYIAPRYGTRPNRDFITIFYRGKFIAARYQGYDFPANITGWFPHLPHKNLGQFIIKYTYYKDLTLNSVGEQISQTDSGDFRTSVYKSTADISYISFALGKYTVYGDTVKNVPIRLFIDNQNDIGLFNRDIPQKVLSIVSQSFATYCQWFGPPIIKKLDVVDRMYFAGQSSPGLIHLPTYSIFHSKDQAHLCSHEVAHQWWGHTAVPKTYRDVWLSEGLAEYTSYLYLHDVKKDKNACRDLIETWRRQVVQVGKIGDLYSRGYRAGPITLGGRFYQSYSPGDYIALIYAKAAYMLRMLHFELDGPDYKSHRFLDLLADYCHTYRGKGASSIDFAKITGIRLGDTRSAQFFIQWLYGWRIPSYSCQYEITADEKGQSLIKLAINVSGVDSGFYTPFPVEVEFADGSRKPFRINNVGLQSEFLLGPFPQAIKKVRFDPDNILLYDKKKVVEP